MGNFVRRLFGIILIWMGLAHLTTFFSFWFMYEPFVSFIVIGSGVILIFISRAVSTTAQGVRVPQTPRNTIGTILGVLTLIIGILQLVYYVQISFPFPLPVIADSALAWVLILIGVICIFSTDNRANRPVTF